MRNIRATARPLLFRTGNADTPISTWGTCFLVGRGGRYFAVTAEHLVKKAHSSSVVILPCPKAEKPLSLSRGFTWAEDSSGAYDAIAYEVSVTNLRTVVAKESRIIRLDYLPTYEWEANAFNAMFFLMGYPGDVNSVDYDKGQVLSSQVVLAGRYDGVSDIQGTIHRLIVENPLELSHFYGLSGSPVMCLTPRFCSEPTMAFCGIAILGTPESGLVHFLESKTIVSLLDHAVEFWDGRLPGSQSS